MALKINLSTNQVDLQRSKTTVENASTRRIQWWFELFLMSLSAIFLNNSPNNEPVEIFKMYVDAK